MTAARLRHVITVQRVTELPNLAAISPGGTPQLVWEHVITLRAEVEAAEGRDAMEPPGNRGRADVVFRVRGQTPVTTADRVLFKATPLRIDRVEMLAHGRWLRLHCFQWAEVV